jgi:hypothetical protein
VTSGSERESERLQVLRLIQDGRVTPEQGAALLHALEPVQPNPVRAPEGVRSVGAGRESRGGTNGYAAKHNLDYMDDRPADRPTSGDPWSALGPYVVAADSGIDGPQWLRLRVTDRQGRATTDVQLPLSIVRVGLHLGSRWLPQLRFLDPGMVLGMLRVRTGHRVFAFQDGPDGDRVEITVE